MDYQQVADQFLSWLRTQIPLINHMGFKPLQYDGRSLVMAAELAPNVNDKGTGFGGSLATVATLCGWSMVTLYRREQGFDNDVVIRDSHLEYLAPVTGDFAAHVVLPDEATLAAFDARMAEKGRARIDLTIEIRQGDKVAMKLAGSYVAMGKVR
ncbi:YiiD C-terminal domain-containing protein [Marinobacterium arenosum]|uniref:YiiD C-terminal domain-containing protein n=1 Tax=Marinobacterium arenosum TaxID=2862496 RepID=UPI001C981E36|nr:YiiD C-terminal domain-containing protein [Marinobacterium arenosum]MBY4675443.1 thioesterase domain-containing protein [Marinobacterium arenosum]